MRFITSTIRKDNTLTLITFYNQILDHCFYNIKIFLFL